MLLPLLRPSFGFRAATPFHFPTLNISISTYTSNTALRSPNSASILQLFHPSSFSTATRTQTRTHAISLSRRLGRPPPLLFTTLALSSGLLAPQFFKHPTRNDSGADFSSSSSAPYSHGRDAKTPLSADGGKTLNPAAIRQISTGAILGLGLGVMFSALSRMLVLVLGVGIVVWQYAARKGYNIVPVDRMQRYVKGVNLRSAINDNAAFKISFGLMFALTAFGEF